MDSSLKMTGTQCSTEIKSTWSCLHFPVYFRRLVLEHIDKLYGPVIFYEERIKYWRHITYVLRLIGFDKDWQCTKLWSQL